MKLLGKSVFDELKKNYPETVSRIESLQSEIEAADWETPHDVKQKYASASILAGNQVVFNIKGNKYRVLVQISYKNKIVLIKKAGTHKEYNKW